MSAHQPGPDVGVLAARRDLSKQVPGGRLSLDREAMLSRREGSRATVSEGLVCGPLPRTIV